MFEGNDHYYPIEQSVHYSRTFLRGRHEAVVEQIRRPIPLAADAPETRSLLKEPPITGRMCLYALRN